MNSPKVALSFLTLHVVVGAIYYICRQCVTDAKRGGCTELQVVHYDMVVSTVLAMCNTGTSSMHLCMGNIYARIGLDSCFNRLNTDISIISTEHVDQHIYDMKVCNAYSGVDICANRFVRANSGCVACVPNILHARTSCVTKALHCSLYK